MTVAAVGLNHRTAPIDMRERIAFSPGEIPEALTAIRRDGIEECLLLSTCNRTEIYCSLEELDPETAMRWLSQARGMDPDSLRPYLFSLTGTEAVHHVLRVAGGLESLVLGEPQILGQLKNAYRVAVEQGAVGRNLNRLLQVSFRVAKQVRRDTGIGSEPVSVAYAAVRLAQQLHGDLRQLTALLVGAGDTIELVAQHLTGKGLSRVVVANRSADAAHRLASAFGGLAVTLSEVDEQLRHADIIVSATGSTDPVIRHQPLAGALKSRRRRPIFAVDLAVPRDIEPSAADLPDLYLYNVDDLEGVIESNQKMRQQAASVADDIIASEARQFIDWHDSNEVQDLISQLHLDARTVANPLIDKTLKRLERGDSPRESLEALAEALTSRLLHRPVTSVREASESGRDDLLEGARELFGLGNGAGDDRSNGT